MLLYRFNEEEIIKNLKEIYRLTGTKWPDQIIVCEDIFDERFQAMAMAMATAMARATDCVFLPSKSLYLPVKAT